MSENQSYGNKLSFDPAAEEEAAALIAGLQSGSEKAFELLWKRFYKRVLYFSRRYISETEAQDVTTEVFVQLWNKRDGFDTVSKVSNFLFVAARNRCYNIIRDRQNQGKHAAELAALMENDTGDFFPDQLRVELIQLINDQVNLLPEKTRRVFLLSFEEGLKPSEIAEKLGVSVKTVKNQKLSAIRLLKSALQPYPIVPALLFFLEFKYFLPQQ